MARTKKEALNRTVMKTVLEWFEQAKKEGHPWVDAAIRNSNNLKGKNPDLATALAAAFVWKSSPEKDEYWRDIYLELTKAAQ